MSDLKMPSLGADMDFGTLVRWHVRAGDAVHRGQVVAEVETQKGVFDVDIREDGVLQAVLVAEGTRVPVGTVLARVGAEVGVPAPAPAPQPIEAVAAAPAPLRPAVAPRRRASPLARRIAAERGVDLATVQGSGEGGVITRADVERSAATSAAVPAAPAAAPADRASSMRQAIAAAMSRSKREIPHYYLSQELDVGAPMEWLRGVNATRGLDDRILPAALILKATARALEAYREFNGFWSDGAFQPAAAVHLGVVIALRGGGVVAPAVHDAAHLSLEALMRTVFDLVERARAGRLRTSELTDATATVTSLGDGGAQTVFGVIYPPQVAIIGFGGIASRPWAVNGMLGVRETVTASLAADHRASDGHRGAQLLGAIQRLLLEPEAL